MSISCVNCNYSITEPLCASCVIKEVKVWFYEKRIAQNIVSIVNKKLNHLLKRVDLLNYVLSPFEDIKEESIMKCIKCKNGMHLMCLYCVINQASQIVKSNLNSKIMMESFEESFNTNLYDYELKKDKEFSQLRIH